VYKIFCKNTNIRKINIFHEKFGVGKIKEVVKQGSDFMYSVDFGKLGEKAFDASYGNLKKF